MGVIQQRLIPYSGVEADKVAELTAKVSTAVAMAANRFSRRPMRPESDSDCWIAS